MINKTHPLVSVVVPLYNQERYLDTCIRSICRQTYSNIEIVIVNDGSTDNSPQMARNWASRDRRIKIVDKQNEGLSLARRDGYRAATGDYLCFVDSDDYIPLDAIEVMVSYSLDNDVDVLFGSITKKLGFITKNLDNFFSFPFYQVVKQPVLFDEYYLGFFLNSIFSINAVGHLYRKSVIDKAIKEKELFSTEIRFMAEDHYFNLQLFPYLNSMYRIKKTVYYYRFGGGTSKYIADFPKLLMYCDMRLELLDHYNYNAGYAPLFDEYISCFYFQAAQMLQFKKSDKKEVIDFFKDEFSKRKIVPRLIDYYKTKNTQKKAALLIDHDFEGMYDYAYALKKKQWGSLKYKFKQLFMSILARM